MFQIGINISNSIKMHQERTNKRVNKEVKEGAQPAYLLDREKTNRAKVWWTINNNLVWRLLISIFRCWATWLNKRERRRSANGMFLFPKLSPLLRTRSSRSSEVESARVCFFHSFLQCDVIITYKCKQRNNGSVWSPRLLLLETTSHVRTPNTSVSFVQVVFVSRR